MRKVVAAINMTLDGVCDHTVGIADDEMHQHYTDLLRSGGTLLYGRITYHLMQSYWPAVVKDPTGNKTTDDFALAIQDIPKIVFSRTLKKDDPTIVGWKNATLAQRGLKEEVSELRQSSQGGSGDIFVGSPGLIAALTNLNLIDEYQLNVQPIIAGKGLPLFKNITEKIMLTLLKTKTFSASGSMIHYYERKDT